jgi:hypothetical protein
VARKVKKKEAKKAKMKIKENQQGKQQRPQKEHQHQHLQLKMLARVVLMKANIQKIIVKMRNNPNNNNIAMKMINQPSELYFLSRAIPILV